ncbi:hypothetical protein ACF1BS_03265 [Streptomyces sp. NPDC014748]|uniref:hypothetical protein n=1 Tax=Streptomyces sp. NPDC014748 TaxID=3364905 RepID=UPI0036F77616
MDLHAWITQQVDRVEADAVDPPREPWLVAGVLRRCEADRRILARHAVDPSESDSLTFATACHGCGTEGDCDDPVTENVNDCPELLDLAHAHGITDDILAGLDRPQPPEPTPAQKRRLRERARLTASAAAALRGPHWKP